MCACGMRMERGSRLMSAQASAHGCHRSSTIFPCAAMNGASGWNTATKIGRAAESDHKTGKMISGASLWLM